MDLKGFVDATKEFIWDIIGYLIPGFLLIILLSIFSNQSYFFPIPIINFEKEFLSFTMIIVAYALGHLIYGITLSIDQILDKYLYKISKKAIEDDIEKSVPFKISQDLVENDLKTKGSNRDITQLSTRDLRNYVMSYFPENDRKVYTFMFRSELSNHIMSMNLILCILGLISWGIASMGKEFIFKSDFEYIIIYLLLLISLFPLHKTKTRFYGIAMRIPFQMFNSNYPKK